MNIFVGNLSRDVSDDELKELFANYGHIRSVKIIRDMFSQESKGFGFVDMPGVAEAQKAINELNTRELKGKKISVSEARPRTDRRGGGNQRSNARSGGGKRW